MPRRARQAPGGLIYHVLNRGNGRQDIFHTDADAAAFLRVLKEAKALIPVRRLAFCLMSNHWHLVLWPHHDGDLSRFLFWLTNTHVRRYRLFKHSVGGGHLYQSRFKSFAVQDDDRKPASHKRGRSESVSSSLSAGHRRS
jgi:putative transposase